MSGVDFDNRELRLLRYALGFLESSLDPDLAIEAAQETWPDTQTTGQPLPDVREQIQQLKSKLSDSQVTRLATSWVFV